MPHTIHIYWSLSFPSKSPLPINDFSHLFCCKHERCLYFTLTHTPPRSGLISGAPVFHPLQKYNCKKSSSTERINAASLHRERKKEDRDQAYRLSSPGSGNHDHDHQAPLPFKATMEEARRTHCFAIVSLLSTLFNLSWRILSTQFRNRTQTIFSTYKTRQSCPSRTASATFAAAS